MYLSVSPTMEPPPASLWSVVSNNGRIGPRSGTSARADSPLVSNESAMMIKHVSVMGKGVRVGARFEIHLVDTGKSFRYCWVSDDYVIRWNAL